VQRRGTRYVMARSISGSHHGGVWSCVIAPPRSLRCELPQRSSTRSLRLCCRSAPLPSPIVTNRTIWCGLRRPPRLGGDWIVKLIIRVVAFQVLRVHVDEHGIAEAPLVRTPREGSKVIRPQRLQQLTAGELTDLAAVQTTAEALDDPQYAPGTDALRRSSLASADRHCWEESRRNGLRITSSACGRVNVEPLFLYRAQGAVRSGSRPYCLTAAAALLPSMTPC
jgi:hypothetical protein